MSPCFDALFSGTICHRKFRKARSGTETVGGLCQTYLADLKMYLTKKNFSAIISAREETSLSYLKLNLFLLTPSEKKT